MLKNKWIIFEVPAEHVIERFVNQVKKDIQPEPDPFSQDIGYRGKEDINLISNFAFEETEVAPKSRTVSLMS
jgi:hypothetical protein